VHCSLKLQLVMSQLINLRVHSNHFNVGLLKQLMISTQGVRVTFQKSKKLGKLVNFRPPKKI